jgi:hypothetical protein
MFTLPVAQMSPLGRTLRHHRRRLQQTQPRRAPSIWRQLVTSRVRAASPSRVHVRFLYPLQQCTTQLKNTVHKVAREIYSEKHGGFSSNRHKRISVILKRLYFTAEEKHAEILEQGVRPPLTGCIITTFLAREKVQKFLFVAFFCYL